MGEEKAIEIQNLRKSFGNKCVVNGTFLLHNHFISGCFDEMGEAAKANF